MIRLNAYPHLFTSIRLEQCAILFLATPHLGSGQADWNKYIVDLVELIGGMRSDAIINPLRSFNPISASANEDFGNMRVQLPYECYYETEATKVAGMNLQVSRDLITIQILTRLIMSYAYEVNIREVSIGYAHSIAELSHASLYVWLRIYGKFPSRQRGSIAAWGANGDNRLSQKLPQH
jgi:hypothetical protein